MSGSMQDTPRPPARPARRRTRDRWIGIAVSALLALPYGWRVRLAGALGGALARIGGLPRRIARAVRHFRPDLPEAEVGRIARAVPGNLARMGIEIFSGAAFAARAARYPIAGPGLAALDAAHAAGRPVVLVTAHFGNYDAWRAALIARGFRVGGYFKEMAGLELNARYVAAIEAIGQPLFATGREGVAGMVRFLRGGGMLGILIDLDRPNGVMLDFLGQPTRTVLSMAEMALRYDALLVPVWGIRQPDGLDFRIQIDAPIPHSTPEAMTQALNDALAAMVREHPEQWLWWHNRRKSGHP